MPPGRRGITARFTELRPFAVVAYAVLVVLALLAAYPLLRVLMRLFIVDGRLDFSAFGDMLDQPGLGTLLKNTAILVIASTALGTAIAAMLAWLLERTDARMGGVTAALPMLPFLLPPIAGAVGWVLALSEGSGLVNALIRWLLSFVGIDLETGPFNIYSWWGMIFVTALYIVPYVYMMIASGLRNVDPALEEAARVSGAGRLRILRTVTLPAIRGSLGAGVLLSVWVGVSIFSVPIILGTGARIQVLSVRIVQLLRGTYPPETGAAVGLSTFVLFTVGTVWYFQRRSLDRGNFASVGGKGHRTTPVRLGRWRWPARLSIMAYLFVAVAIPFICLLVVALRGFWTTKITWGDLSFDTFRRFAEDEFTRTAMRNSLQIGLVGGLVGIVAAAIVALQVRRSRTRMTRTLDAIVKLPAVISAVVLGVGFILAFSGSPFSLGGSLWILFLGYLALYMPQASIAADAAAAQVGKELSEASHVAGAGLGRTTWRVELPVMLPGLVAGWSLLFARMVEEITMSALLSTPKNMVIGPRILEIFDNATYADLAAISVILTLITATVVLTVLVLSRRRGSSG